LNWDAVGAIGEIIGAMAVVITLVVLIFQIRQGTKATIESNQLEKALAVDRHSVSVARWRGRITENADLSELWLRVRNDDLLTEVELLRVNNLWIEFTNTQRSNFVRAEVVGEHGLAEQAVMAVAVEARVSHTFTELWSSVRPWLTLSNPKFLAEVDEKIRFLEQQPEQIYKSVPVVRQKPTKSAE